VACSRLPAFSSVIHLHFVHWNYRSQFNINLEKIYDSGSEYEGRNGPPASGNMKHCRWECHVGFRLVSAAWEDFQYIQYKLFLKYNINWFINMLFSLIQIGLCKVCYNNHLLNMGNQWKMKCVINMVKTFLIFVDILGLCVVIIIWSTWVMLGWSKGNVR